MRAVPVFKSDPKPEEAEIDMERVNAWPLYFKDGDVRSVFWPLYTRTAQGHALVPFYEYRNGDRSLRVGQITHLLPALASFEPERNHSWRLLLAYKEDAVARLGDFSRQRDDGFLLVPPVLFWNGETLWTPLIARGKGDEHSMWGLLYPLFFVEKRDGEKRAFALAPLIGTWWGGKSAGGHVLPIVHFNRRDTQSEGKRDTRFNLGVILAHYYRNPHTGKSYKYLGWPILQHSNRGYDGDTWRGGWVNVLALVFHHYRTPDKNYTIALWPLYQRSDRGVDHQGNSRGKWTNVLGLVVHRYRDSEISRGHILWPLWIDRVSVNQEKRLANLKAGAEAAQADRTHTLSVRYAFAGLYGQRREVSFTPGENLSATKPAEAKQTIRDRSRFFPLYWSERDTDGARKFFFLGRVYDARRVPLATDEGEWRRERILWRVYRREQRGTRTATDSFPFVSSASDTATGFRRWTLAGGLLETRREEGIKTVKFFWIPVSRKNVSQN
jgi:hypothetical protein